MFAKIIFISFSDKINNKKEIWDFFGGSLFCFFLMDEKQ